MEKIFINKKTSGIIDNDTIIAQDSDGIVVNNSNCWKYINSDNLSSKNIYNDYYPEEELKDRELKPYQNKYLLNQQDVDDAYQEKAQYVFGFKNLRIYTKINDKVSGTISKDIDVSNCTYITINCQIENKDNGSIELSILDGDKETSILPQDIKKVIKEKLFFNMGTRFQIDNVNAESPVLYEDNVESTKKYLDLTADDFENHEYALTYTAAGDNNKYTPENNTINIKLIIRQYDAELEAIKITKCVINKFGGTLEWT